MNLQEYKTRYYAGNDRMNPALENKIKNKLTNLSKNPAFPSKDKEGNQYNFEELIAYKRFLDCVDKVKRYSRINDLTSPQSFMMLQQKLLMALQRVVQIEKPHREYLEKLGIKLVIDEMELPQDAFNFDAKIVDLGTIEHNKFQKESKEPTENEIEVQFGEQAKEEYTTANDYFKLLKEKRRFVNMLIQGASKKGHYMFELVREDLNKLNPDLADMYGLIMSINDYTYWVVPENLVEQNFANPQITAGKEEIDNSGETPKIITRGVYFPVSVHENIKGVMDIFGSHGLPDGEIEQQMVMNSTDTMYNEIWDIRIGAGAWERFLSSYPMSVFEQGSRYLQHHLFMRFCQLEPEEFFRVARLIMAGNQKGSEYMEKMVDDIIYDLKKEDLEGLGFADGGDVRKMSWAERFRDKIPFEMVVVAKESEKDGGNEIVFNLLVQAQNDVTAYQEARKQWNEQYESSDMSIKKVYTKKEYDNLKKEDFDSLGFKRGGEIKSIKDLNKYLVHKQAGFNYHYVIGDYKFEINEFNDQKGWALNTYKKNKIGDWYLFDSYGYEGFTLRECKYMILQELKK